MKYLKEAIRPHFILALFLGVLTARLLDFVWYYEIGWIIGYWVNLEIYRIGRTTFLSKVENE